MEILNLDGVALRSDGPTLTLSVRTGQCVAIMGPTKSGRSSLLRVCAGRDRAPRGKVTALGEFAVAGEEMGRRAKVSSVAKTMGHPKANDLLVALGLANVLNDPVAELVAGHRAAIEALPTLLSGAPLLAFDRTFDRLDPWAHSAAWGALRTAMGRGASALIVTDRSDLASLCDAIVVLRDRQVRFAGTVDALRRLGPPHELSVTTERQIGVRALVSPFEVAIEETPEGLRLSARDGQELVARLLREGYGDVRYIVSRAPTLEEGLHSL